MYGEPKPKNGNFQSPKLMIPRMNILRMGLINFQTQILIITTYIKPIKYFNISHNPYMSNIGTVSPK